MIIMKHLLKMSKYLLLILSVFILSVILLSSLFLFTHTGNQVIFKLVQQFESRLSIELVEGSLFNSPRYQHISWIDGETSIKIDTIDYQFDWSCLTKRVCLKTLTINGANIAIAETNQTAPPKENEQQEPVSIDIPIEITIDSINLNQISFVMGELAVDLDSLTLQANAFKKDISLSSQIKGLLVTLPNSSTPLKKTVSLPSATKSDVKQKVNFNIDSLPAILTNDMLPRIALPINLTVQPINIDNVKVIQNNETLFQLHSLQSAFVFKDTQLSIQQFLLDIPETTLSLNAKLNFIDDYPLEVNVDGKIKLIKQLEPATLLSDINFKLTSQGSLSNLSSELQLSNKINLQLRTRLDLFTANLPHSIQLDWQHLQWPLTGDADVKSVQGSLSSAGSLLDNQINLFADYVLADNPGGQVSLRTKGDLQQLQIESLKVETLSGEIDFSGLLTWPDEINWLGQLKVSNIDLKKLDTAYDGQLSGIIKQQVAVTVYENSEPDWQFDFPELNIDGELLSRPLTLEGRVSGNNVQGISFEQLTAKNADNTFIVNGTLAEQNDLTVALDIKDISHALIGAQGEISGDLALKGPANTLAISSDLSATALAYQQYKVEDLKLSSTVILTEKPQLTLDLSANNIRVEQQIIDDIKLQISNKKVANTNIPPINNDKDNSQYRHQIELALNNELVSTALSAYVTQTDDELLTQLNRATLFLPHQTLTLTAPFNIISQPNMFSITDHCWQAKATDLGEIESHNAGKVCLKKLNVGESGQAIIDIDSYLLSNINPFLPAQFKLEGELSADADISWLADSNPTFKVNILSEDMLVKINNDVTADEFIHYPMKKFAINALGNDEKVTIDATMLADNFIDVNVKGHLLPYGEKPSINSLVNINLPDFSLLLPLIPHIEQLKGQLTSQLTIVGDLTKPDINGEIKIQGGTVVSATLPMKINELKSVIVINETKATIKGSFNTSDTNTIIEKAADIPLLTNTINIFDKSLKKVTQSITHQSTPPAESEVKTDAVPGVAFIEGKLDFSDKLAGEVHLYAHKLQIYDYGKLDLIISPDLYVKIADHVNLTGDLFVDEGKIVVKELPAGAVSQSKDIVVIDIDKEKPAPDLPIVIDLSVDTGNKFQIVALGLNTFINGQLLIKKPLNQDLSINGKLNFTDGSYRSFGQQLVLQKSSVSFQGDPETPYLKIEAIRDPAKVEDDVTAGVRVTGTPDDLALVIFSEPGMAQQEALSYLTRGQSLDSTSGGNSTMANMLIDIAAGQSGGLISSIGEGVGIKDLSLSTSGAGDEQSVGVRGEIAPGVELSYGVGVFDTFSIFAIRYEMFERFYIEASSGIDQAVDAYYEWDWD